MAWACSGDEYTTACDVYSLAIVIWEVLSRQRPHAEMHQPAVLGAVAVYNRRHSPTLNVSSELIALIEKANLGLVCACDPCARIGE
jgi:hypothetical protein